MNLYFVLEGDQTEPKVFPKWIEYILDDYTEVDFFNEATNNNYYMFSGGGIPSIYNHVINAIKDINDTNIYDRLIVCLDAEDIGVEDRKQKVLKKIVDNGVILNEKCQLEIVVQNVCIETWFLGNKKVVKNNPQSPELISLKNFYDVSENDPEQMTKQSNFTTKAQFHFKYFREVLKERNQRYSKSNPKIVTHETYFNELRNRVSTTEHIKSFKNLLDILEEIKSLS